MTGQGTTRRVFAAGGLGAALVAGSGARAQAYPARPVTIVVPFAAGSGTDNVAHAQPVTGVAAHATVAAPTDARRSAPMSRQTLPQRS